jgi:hypothetical protein
MTTSTLQTSTYRASGCACSTEATRRSRIPSPRSWLRSGSSRRSPSCRRATRGSHGCATPIWNPGVAVSSQRLRSRSASAPSRTRSHGPGSETTCRKRHAPTSTNGLRSYCGVHSLRRSDRAARYAHSAVRSQRQPKEDRMLGFAFKLELADGRPADPPMLRTAVMTWPGDTIPLGGRTRVVAVREDDADWVGPGKPPPRWGEWKTLSSDEGNRSLVWTPLLHCGSLGGPREARADGVAELPEIGAGDRPGAGHQPADRPAPAHAPRDQSRTK